MQRPVLLRGPRLEAGLVAGDGGEVVPHPPDHVLALLHAAEVVRQPRLVREELVLGQRGVLDVPPRADEQDVAELDLGVVLCLQARLQVGQRDRRRREAVEVPEGGVRLRLAPRREVDEDPPADDALFGPGWTRAWLAMFPPPSKAISLLRVGEDLKVLGWPQ